MVRVANNMPKLYTKPRFDLRDVDFWRAMAFLSEVVRIDI